MDLLNKQLLKVLFISFAALFLFLNTTANTKAAESLQISKSVITMEESILKVTTGSVLEIVRNIKIENIATGITKSIHGCFTSKCSYNLNFLSSGKYRLAVTTNYSTTSLIITIN